MSPIADHLTAAALGFVVCELLHLASSRNRHALARLRRLVQRKQQRAGKVNPAGNVNPPPTHAKPPAPPAPYAAPTRSDRAGWVALPGNRLEYGSSGFYVELAPKAPVMHAYQLYSPEGVIFATGPYLEGVQVIGEKMAADRAAFAPATRKAGTA